MAFCPVSERAENAQTCGQCKKCHHTNEVMRGIDRACQCANHVKRLTSSPRTFPTTRSGAAYGRYSSESRLHNIGCGLCACRRIVGARSSRRPLDSLDPWRQREPV